MVKLMFVYLKEVRVGLLCGNIPLCTFVYSLIKQTKMENNRRNLQKGMLIGFFGTLYLIHEVIDYDVVSVKQNNGIIVNLWFPDSPGCEIFSR